MKKGICIGVIIIVILVIGYFIFFKTNDDMQNAIKTGTNTVQKNEQSNNIVAENKIENETVNNEITNETTDNKEQNTISTETFKEEPEEESKKAINIVKNDWGNDNNVKISIDGLNENGSYIVTVRDANTTEALAFYTVDVQNKTFNKREMN